MQFLDRFDFPAKKQRRSKIPVWTGFVRWTLISLYQRLNVQQGAWQRGGFPACSAARAQHHLPAPGIPGALGLGKHSQAWLSKAMPFLENKFLVPTSGLNGTKLFPWTSTVSIGLPRALSCTPIQSLSAGFWDNRRHLGAPHQCLLGCDGSPQPGDTQPFEPSELPGPVELRGSRGAAGGPSRQGPAGLQSWSVAGKERKARGAYCW